MKKENIAIWISFIALATSIASICFCAFRMQPFTFDVATLTLCILGTTVTIYMLIQITNELFLKKRIKKSVEKDFNKKVNDILYHNMYLTFFFQGINEFRGTHYETSLYYLFKSIECLMKTNIDRDKLDEIIMKIKKIKDDFPATKILEHEIEEYTRIIASTGHKESGKIIEILNSMKE